MADEREEEGWAPSKAQIAGGFLAGHAKAIEGVGESLIEDAPRGARFLLKRVPKGPPLVFDLTQFATSPNKTRTAFGVIGGLLGDAGGGAVGGPAAPVTAALGAVVGEKLGERLYDQHAAEIDHGVEATKRWMHDRIADLARAPKYPAGWKY